MTQPRLKLADPVERLSGVGPVIRSGLRRLGISTVADLLNYHPFRWEDYSKVRTIAQLQPGMASVRARVEHLASRRGRNRRLYITEAILSDDTGTVRATWFNVPYMSRLLRVGQSYYFAGDYRFSGGFLGFANPTFEQSLGKGRAGSIVAVYHENQAVSSTALRRLLAQCLELSDELAETLPAEVIAQNHLMGRAQAIRTLHQPPSAQALARARWRLGFEEIFMLVLTALLIKAETQAQTAVAIAFDQTSAQEFVKNLPFALTDAQRKAAFAILRDMASTKPMSRLLMGDVGSGKTAVALMAAYQAVQAGYQVALMAPTEVLARQHLKTATTLLRRLDVEVGVLVASQHKSEQEKITKGIRDGRVQLVVGTHALLGEQIQFANLGLVIIDEQHRFGVAQRKHLRSGAQRQPHVLTMTATPIPRSLALVIYGDLDVSRLDELPVGRQPVVTRLVEEPDRSTVEEEIDVRLARGEQAFVVCPLIEPSDRSGAKSAEAEYERLQQGTFSHRRIGLVHGRLKPEQKSQVMTQFVNGELDILVATSVIEVGIDVPQATTMIIEGAERFGLASLHQLRGRVGRGQKQSHCYLFTSEHNESVLQRLRAMESTNDGFRLASLDLTMRGPGEIYGSAQAGRLQLKEADLTNAELIEAARRSAKAFMLSGNLVKYPWLAQYFEAAKSITTLD